MRYIVHTERGAVYNLGGPNLTWQRVNPERPISNMSETQGVLRVMPIVTLDRSMVLELVDNKHENITTTRVTHAECWDD